MCWPYLMSAAVCRGPCLHALLILCCVLTFSCTAARAGWWPLSYLNDNAELTVSHHLSRQERAKLPRTVEGLTVESGADEDILDDPKLFSHLKVITLHTGVNDDYVQALASNYPRIRVLCISQRVPLSPQAMSCFQYFKNLTGLELHCPLATAGLLRQFIPKNLNLLWISQTCELPRLGKLNHLTLADCSVEASFFDHLDAPKLEILSLSQATIEDGALQPLSKFFRLNFLDLPKSFDKKRDSVSKLTPARIYVQGDPLGPPPKLVAPLRPLPDSL